jgi:hypothetical protein
MQFTPAEITLHEGGIQDPYRWTMTAPLSWSGAFRGEPRTFTVPASEAEPFTTDLASVPRSLTWLFPRYGKYTKAAVVHDFLCQSFGRDPGGDEVQSLLPLEDRSDADELFRTLMEQLGVAWLRRSLMWAAVSWATLFTCLTVGRQSRRLQRTLGFVVLAVAVLGLAALLVTSWGVSTVVIVALALPAGVLLAGTVALGRGRRCASAPAIYLLTVAFSPLIVLGAVIAMVLVVYLVVEDAFEGFANLRAFVRNFTRAQRVANLATPRGARIIAMRRS